MIVEIFLVALAFATLIGWAYFWFVCINSAEKVLKPIFGNSSLAVVLIGFPFVFFGGFYLIITNIGRENLSVFFWVIALALPSLGVWAIKRGKW